MTKGLPVYAERAREFLENEIPSDVSYIFLCQRYPAPCPSLITTIEGDRKQIAKILKEIAASLDTDA